MDPGLFPFLDEGEAKALSGLLSPGTYAPGEVIWREGDPADSVAFIAQGRVEMKKATEFEGSHVVVGLYAPGSALGECALSQGRRTLTAVAEEPTELLFLPLKEVERLSAESPRLAAKLFKALLLSSSRRLDQAYRRIALVF